MSRLGKISFIFAVITLLCFAISKFYIQEWIPFFWVLIGLFALFVGVGVFVDRKFFFEFFTLKTTKHGMNMGVLIFGFISLVILANILGVRHSKTWDFSLNQVNSLSDQSIKIIQDLKSDLSVLYFYKKNSKNYDMNRKVFTELIRKYQDKTEKIKLDFVDADARPDLTEKYQFRGEQAVYLDFNGKKNRVDKIDEQELTSALVKVTREKSKTIYFTSGHGEPETESLDKAEGVGHLKQLLENNNYTVKTLNLAAMSQMPEDMDVLFVVTPQYPFQPLEIRALEGYLRSGGSVLMALSHPDRSGLSGLLSKLGVELQSGFVMNVINTPMGAIIDPSGPTKGSGFSSSSAITRVFSKNDGLLFVKPLSFKKMAKLPEGVSVEELVKAPSSVAFTDAAMKNQGPVGDYTLAVAITGPFPEGGTPDKKFNLVAVGDSHFLENQLLYSFVNRDMVLNSIAMLAKEENLISITPKEPAGTRMDLTAGKETILVWGVFLPIPFMFFISSIFFWVRRRHA